MKALYTFQKLGHLAIFSIILLSTIVGSGQSAGGFFSTGPNMSNTRIYPMMATLENGNVLILGGRENGFVSCQNADIYDPNIGYVISYALNSPRDAFGMTKMLDGRYFICGGGYDLGIPAYSDAEIFDPADQTFTPVINMIFARMQNSCIALENGKILIVGGWYNDITATYGEVYDPVANNYLATGELTYHRASPLLFPTDDGGAVVIGGWPAFGGELYTEVEYYDANNNTFSVLSSEIIAGDAGWLAYAVNRPVSELRLPNGKYAFIAYKAGDPDPLYALMLFDPTNKSFEKYMELDVHANSPCNYVVDMTLEKNGMIAYLLTTKADADPQEISLINIDLQNELVYYPDETYTMGISEYVFPSMAWIPQDGALLIAGINAHNADYFGATNKTLLVIPEFTSDITDSDPLRGGAMQIFPNPNFGECTIRFDVAEQGVYMLRITDMRGKYIYGLTVSAHPGLNDVALQGICFPAGIYQVELLGRGMHSSGKLLITR